MRKEVRPARSSVPMVDPRLEMSKKLSRLSSAHCRSHMLTHRPRFSASTFCGVTVLYQTKVHSDSSKNFPANRAGGKEGCWPAREGSPPLLKQLPKL